MSTAGNPGTTSCIVACQDRVWRDIHYQMDAFDDGKFPLGTDCSFGSNVKSFCINGKCLKFDDEDLPLDQRKYSSSFISFGS